MKIHQRLVSDVAIVAVTGDLVINSAQGSLKDTVAALIQQGTRQIVVDLGDVPYMDSSGLGELVAAYASTKKAGGALKLMRTTRKLKDLLTITKLVTLFDNFDDEATALASFRA